MAFPAAGPAVPIFLATLAVRQKCQTVCFRSEAEMLDTFGVLLGGHGASDSPQIWTSPSAVLVSGGFGFVQVDFLLLGDFGLMNHLSNSEYVRQERSGHDSGGGSIWSKSSGELCGSDQFQLGRALIVARR
jgi:hypothetical protein